MLEHLNLSLPSRGLVFIHGNSGSGKSTLLSIIGGFLKPTSGSIANDGLPCSLVVQESSLIDGATVEENTSLALTLSGVKEEARTKTSRRLLLRLRIDSLAQKRACDLSGGERQRVAAAAAIIAGRTILADEPTGALDASNAKELMEILREYSSEHLVVVVSHDLTLVNQYADAVYRLEGGHLYTEKNLPPSPSSIAPTSESKGKMRLIDKLKLGWSLLRGKSTRLFISALAIGFSFASLAAAISIGQSADSFARGVTESFFAQDTLIVSESSVVEQSSGMALSKQEELSQETAFEMEAMLDAEIYPSLSFFVPSYLEIDLVETYFDCAVDPYLTASRKVSGSLPNEFDEVIANRSLADSLGYAPESLIGMRFSAGVEKEFALSTSVGTERLSYRYSFVFTITGVCDENTTFNNPAVYYSYELMRDHLQPLTLCSEDETEEDGLELSVGDLLSSSAYQGSETRSYQSLVRVPNIEQALSYLEEREDLLCASRIVAASSTARELGTSISTLSTIFLAAIAIIATAIEIFTLASILIDTRPECAVLLTLSPDERSFRRSLSGIGFIFALGSLSTYLITLLFISFILPSLLSLLELDMGFLSPLNLSSVAVGTIMVLICLFISSFLVNRIKKDDLYSYLRTDR